MPPLPGVPPVPGAPPVEVIDPPVELVVGEAPAPLVELAELVAGWLSPSSLLHAEATQAAATSADAR
jgi:hypothetical protein